MGPHLLLTHDFPPRTGGVSRFMGELARRYQPEHLLVSTALDPDGFDSDSGFPNRIDRMPVDVRGLRSLPGILQWSRRAAMLAREHAATFTWCGGLVPDAYPAKWVRERLDIPYGVLLHGADLLMLQHQVHRSAVRRRAARALLRSAAVLVANSRYTRELALGVVGELGISTADDPVRVVPLGTDPERFRPGLDAGAVRARYGIDGGPWLLTVTRPAPFKGVDVVLRAMALLRERHPEVRYAVAGGADRGGELRAQAAALGVAERVRFLPPVPESELPALYNAADIYVGATRRVGLNVEGFGIALMEASASGRPVIAGRSGGIPEAVRDGETGLLVDAEHPESVAAAITRLVEDPAAGAAMGAAGRRLAETFYNWDRVTADLIGIAQEFRGAAGIADAQTDD